MEKCNKEINKNVNKKTKVKVYATYHLKKNNYYTHINTCSYKKNKNTIVHLHKNKQRKTR